MSTKPPSTLPDERDRYADIFRYRSPSYPALKGRPYDLGHDLIVDRRVTLRCRRCHSRGHRQPAALGEISLCRFPGVSTQPPRWVIWRLIRKQRGIERDHRVTTLERVTGLRDPAPLACHRCGRKVSPDPRQWSRDADRAAAASMTWMLV